MCWNKFIVKLPNGKLTGKQKLTGLSIIKMAQKRPFSGEFTDNLPKMMFTGKFHIKSSLLLLIRIEKYSSFFIVIRRIKFFTLST